MSDTSQIHLVLGGNGTIGNAVVNELKKQNLNVRALTLNGNVADTETINLDLSNLNKFEEATKDVSYMYLCIGLPYKTSVWQKEWPIIMKNTISVCKKNSIKLIFFDNVYMYGPPPLPILFDENTNQKPISKKGIVRKQIADQLLSTITNGEIEAVIGRSADFYGPRAFNSVLYISFLERMLKGKKPQLAFATKIEHTFSYTKDNAKALIKLALDQSTYGEVWHLPVGKPVTIDHIQTIFNKNLNTDLKASVLSRPMMEILKLFITPLREVSETLYQFRTPYIMSDAKFMSKFPDFKITDYEEGISEMISSFR